MRIAVHFGEERLELEPPDDRVIRVWQAPTARPEAELKPLAQAALEAPLDYPPLRQNVVPGDQVAIAFDPETPGAAVVLEAVCEALEAGGVDRESITVVGPQTSGIDWQSLVPRGVAAALHDPDDRAHIAYLANTSERRVYLNRALTDADCVVPVARLGYDGTLGYRGPWSAIFPDLSDTETLRAFRVLARDEAPDRANERPALAESANVTWLLGSQFHVGVLPGSGGGPLRVIAGSEAAARAEGAAAVDAAWTCRAERRAALVVAGIGRPGHPGDVNDVAAGVATACSLVERGGKIVVLSRASGPVGAAVRKLAQLDQTHPSLAALRGLEVEDDYTAARQLARALAWADVYLLSALEEEDLEGLDIVPLNRPEEARKLVAASPTCLFLSEAERVRAQVEED